MIIAIAAIGISLCLITIAHSIFGVSKFYFENTEKIKIEITPISATSSFIRDCQKVRVISLETTETPSMVGVIALGMNIVVSGTGNEGLRMRSGAGIDQQTMFVAQEGEPFQIIDGPKVLDSLIWWKIEALNDPGKTGWSVQDYMSLNYKRNIWIKDR